MLIESTLLKPAAVKIAGSLLSSAFSKKLSSIQITKAQKDQIQHCIEGLCEEWLISVMRSLSAMDYEDTALQDFFKHYNRDLEQFVKDEAVAEELVKPLSEATTDYQLDSAFLQQRWEALQFQGLPDDFDIKHICNLYLKRVQKAGIVSADLRSLYLAQLAQDSANYLQAIRGYWPDFSLVRYKERLTTRYKTLDLSALTPPDGGDLDIKILLQDVFIPQTVKENRPPSELPKEQWQHLRQQQYEIVNLPTGLQSDDSKRIQLDWVQQTTKSVLEIFDKRRLVILGDPGSGKSSLARFLLINCLSPKIEAGAAAWLEPLKGCLPILIELRSYIAAVSDGHCDNFLDYLHYLGRSEGYGLNHLDLKAQLKNSPTLVMFDGLDEIFKSADREKIIQEIIGFANDYAKARILITTRIIGYQGAVLRHAHFSEYTLQDLDTEQIQIFAQGWFKLVFNDKPQEIASRIIRIQQAVKHSPAIAQLAGNPLLLTIIVMIAKHRELPRERVKLYEHAVEVLCTNWDVTGHKINDTPADFMSESHKLELLRRIAARMQQTRDGLSGNVILVEDLQEEIESYLSQRWQLPPTEATRIGQAMIEQLRARNFILCFYGVNLYGFVHRTFLEYFCANEIEQRFNKKHSINFEELKSLFLDHYRDSAWHEILRLICGMVDAKFAGQLIDAILPEKVDAFEQSAALTLSIQCLAEIADLSEIPETSKSVLNCLCGWFKGTRPPLFKESEQVKEDPLVKHNFLLKHPRAEELFEKNALPAVEIIGKNWVGRKHEDFVRWIKSTDKWVVSFSGIYCFGRVVAALWSDHNEIQQDLIKLTQGQDESIRLMAFDALARNFKESTKPLLERQLTENKYYGYMWILIEHYGDQEETYTLLRQCLLVGHDNNIRLTMLSALAENHRYQVETYRLITKCLQDDFDAVRRIAVIILARHYRYRSETYGLLKQCLRDNSGHVRSAAIDALAEHYRNQTETNALIKHRLQDNYGSVRQAAVRSLAELNYDNSIKKKLLSLDLDSLYPWLDPLEPITQTRVEQVAEILNLNTYAIRKYYQEIAVDIPLTLEWLNQDSL